MTLKLLKSTIPLNIAYVLMMLTACTNDKSDAVLSDTDSNSRGVSAAISSVMVQGESGNYTLSVAVASSDTGCSQYADWWEVLRVNGSLVYRRILTHSHIDEQPFTRSGGPVAVASDEEIIVRAHMNSVGYGDLVFAGSIEQGLVQQSLNTTFAEELEIAEPLPAGCAF